MTQVVVEVSRRLVRRIRISLSKYSTTPHIPQMRTQYPQPPFFSSFLSLSRVPTRYMSTKCQSDLPSDHLLWAIFAKYPNSYAFIDAIYTVHASSSTDLRMCLINNMAHVHTIASSFKHSGPVCGAPRNILADTDILPAVCL
jgi:hypothetical protein